jgi:hypothetical protein
VEAKSQHPVAGTTQGITADVAEGAVSVATDPTAPTNTNPGNNNLDPTATVIAWAGKKDVPGAAWYDAERTLLSTAMRTPEQVLTVFKVITVMYAIWARETATSEAARSDAAKALIGTASESPQRADMKMNIMRKCGLAN